MTPSPHDNRPRVNGERLWRSLMEHARIGATAKGGICRLTLSDVDREGRDLFARWAREAGMTVAVDRIGNMFARRPGRDESRPPVVVGSHLDTQPTGGKFDGNFGVLSGLEVVRTLNDLGIETEAPVEVVSWTNEEGSRFVPVMMGSGVFAGAFTLDHAYAARDTDGLAVADELERIGYRGKEEPGAQPIGAYFEAHIEQGPVLEETDTVIGVVSGALGLRWYDCTVTGLESHAGSTPMPLRRDALQAAARIMREVVAIADRRAPHSRGTVGFVQVLPNSRNVIPGRVRFSIDLRTAEDCELDAMDAELRACIEHVRDETGLDIALDQVSHFPACRFDPECVATVAESASELGHSHREIVSGAGHDAVYIARVAPSAMIFIPCKDGISHNELESIEPDHATAGADVLLRCVLARAGIAAAD